MSSFGDYSVISLKDPRASTPLLPQEKGANWQKTAVNSGGVVNIVATGLLIAKSDWYHSNPAALAGCYINLGVTLRLLGEVNLPPHIMRAIHNTSARWSLEFYEILWNWYLNEKNPTVQDSLLKGIMAIGGFHTAGDALEALKLKQSDRPDTLADLDLNAPIQNKIIGPNFNNKVGQRLFKAALAVSGAALVTLGYVGETGVENLFKSVGFFALFQNLGFFGMDWIVESLRKIQESEQPLDDFDAIGEQKTNYKAKLLRFVIKITPRSASELITLLIFFNRPEMYIPAGVIYGASQYLAQREFQVLTKETIEGRQAKNHHMAIKIDYTASSVFLLGVLGWFIYGFVQAMDHQKDKKQIEIGSLMACSLSFFFAALSSNISFRPGISGRIVNHLKYLLGQNQQLLTLGYLGFSQISAADDETLKLDSSTKFVCGVIALALYGGILTSNRVQNVSRSRPSPAFSSSLYRSMLVLTIMYYVVRKL